jgi:SOS response associated peptidase (SRAP)
VTRGVTFATTTQTDAGSSEVGARVVCARSDRNIPTTGQQTHHRHTPDDEFCSEFVVGRVGSWLDECKRVGRLKQPFHFGMKDNSRFAFAGLWDRWRSPDGSIAESCTILRITPNQLPADVHDRKPVILDRDHYETWLIAPAEEARGLTELLVPFEAELMTGCEVSSLVNSPQNYMPACVERVVPTNSFFRESNRGPGFHASCVLPTRGARAS